MAEPLKLRSTAFAARVAAEVAYGRLPSAQDAIARGMDPKTHLDRPARTTYWLTHIATHPELYAPGEGAAAKAALAFMARADNIDASMNAIAAQVTIGTPDTFTSAMDVVMSTMRSDRAGAARTALNNWAEIADLDSVDHLARAAKSAKIGDLRAHAVWSLAQAHASQNDSRVPAKVMQVYRELITDASTRPGERARVLDEARGRPSFSAGERLALGTLGLQGPAEDLLTQLAALECLAKVSGARAAIETFLKREDIKPDARVAAQAMLKLSR